MSEILFRGFDFKLISKTLISFANEIMRILLSLLSPTLVFFDIEIVEEFIFLQIWSKDMTFKRKSSRRRGDRA